MLATIFLIPLCLAINAQRNVQVITKYFRYKESVQKDSLKKMVELKTIMPDVEYDLRYATINNFMHQRLYNTAEVTFLRLPVAIALSNVQRELSLQGLSLKVWDAYRPYNVTVKMWKPIKDERYVANPKNGSGHNRGIAIDLTIINRLSRKELNMGTDFDNFSDTAHVDFNKLPSEILQNRSLLKTTMEKYGFKALQTEWWHFYWHNSDFELLDINAKKFKKN